MSAALLRGAAFYGLWVALIGTAPANLAFGVVVAAAAAWTSLRLLPPGPARVRLTALPGLALRFLWQSVVAGSDVARRAFDPRMPLKPGFIAYPVHFPPGAARNAFTSYTSLLPGTVPCGEEDGKVVYHCLDIGQPVAEQLAAEEAVLAHALGRDAPQS